MTVAFTTPVAPTKMTPAMAAEVDLLFDLDGVDPIGRNETIIYGPPGSGKTVLATTFGPGPYRWIAADGESSLKPIKWAVKEGISAIKSNQDLVAYVPTETVQGRYIGPASAFHKMEDMVTHWFSPDEVDKWKVLVLDSLSTINDWAIDLGLGMNVQYPSTAKPLSKSDAINRQAKTRLIIGQQDYKSAMGLVLGFLRNTRTECARHNKDLVILCHEWQDTVEDDEGRVIVTSVRPLLIGGLRESVPKDFSDVWHMEKYNKGTGIEIKVRMHGDNKTMAKSRWGTIMPREVDADYRKMIAVVEAYHAKKD